MTTLTPGISIFEYQKSCFLKSLFRVKRIFVEILNLVSEHMYQRSSPVMYIFITNHPSRDEFCKKEHILSLLRTSFCISYIFVEMSCNSNIQKGKFPIEELFSNILIKFCRFNVSM